MSVNGSKKKVLVVSFALIEGTFEEEDLEFAISLEVVLKQKDLVLLELLEERERGEEGACLEVVDG
jgi:hypothetical protein